VRKWVSRRSVRCLWEGRGLHCDQAHLPQCLLGGVSVQLGMGREEEVEEEDRGVEGWT
jgi:hypothetical protein